MPTGERRYSVAIGDMRETLRGLPDASVDSVICDPPYGLGREPDMAAVLRAWLAGEAYEHKGAGFMSKVWDAGVPGPDYWREVFRVLKPGGHLVAFGGSRTYDLLVLALRLSGFEIKECLHWLHAQGFPKSLNVAQAARKSGLSCQCPTSMVQYPQSRSEGVSHGNVPDMRRTAAGNATESAAQILLDGVRGQGEAHATGSEDVRGLREGMAAGEPLSGGPQSDLLAGMHAGQDRSANGGQGREAAAHGDLPALRQAVPQDDEREATGEILQLRMSGEGIRGDARHERSGEEGPGGLDGQESRVVSAEDERSAQPGMEGRRHAQADTRQLSGRAVRQVPGGIPVDGEDRRLRDGAPTRDGAEARPMSHARRGRASQGPQPAKQSPGQSRAIPQQWGAQTCGSCGKPRIPDGLGTALKPAVEPVVLARKPLAEATIAAQVLATGTGALNIGATRVGHETITSHTKDLSAAHGNKWGAGTPMPIVGHAQHEGRWPANLLLGHSLACEPVGAKRVKAITGTAGGHMAGRKGATYGDGYGYKGSDRAGEAVGYGDADGYETVAAWRCAPGCPVAALDAQSGTSAAGYRRNPSKPNVADAVTWQLGAERGERGYQDTGGASRFFATFYYCPKASRAERDAGCEALDWQGGHNLHVVGAGDGGKRLDGTESIMVQLYQVGEESGGTAWESAGQSVRLLVDTASSRPRVIAGYGMSESDATVWSTFLFGSGATAPSLAECRSITATTTSLITGSKTLRWLTRSLTSASTAGASFEMEHGGSPAMSAAKSNQSLSFTSGETVSLPLVGHVPSGARWTISAGESSAPKSRGNHHPCVKPLSLLRWLIRLTTPPDGVVLDCFAGSGSTGVAALAEGVRVVLCELDADREYEAVIRARMAHAEGATFAPITVPMIGEPERVAETPAPAPTTAPIRSRPARQRRSPIPASAGPTLWDTA